jgi:hypothetical protein
MSIAAAGKLEPAIELAQRLEALGVDLHLVERLRRGLELPG